MPVVSLLGVEHEITAPKRKIYVIEVGSEISARPLRAFSAAVGLGCRGLWATRTEPKYDGRPSVYGEEVFEILSAAGMSDSEILLAGVDVWHVWNKTTVEAKAVEEAKVFSVPAAER